MITVQPTEPELPGGTIVQIDTLPAADNGIAIFII